MTFEYTIRWTRDVVCPLETYGPAPCTVPAASAPAPAVKRRHAFLRGAIGAAALIAAAGCATHDAYEAPKWNVEPIFSVTHSVQAAEASQRYYALGQYFDESKSWGRSVDAYRMAVAGDAHNVEAFNALGVALARLGRYADAEAALRQAVALAPERTSVRNNLGFVLLLAGKPADAMAELQTVVSHDGGNAIALANLHQAMIRSGTPADEAARTMTVTPALPAAGAPGAQAQGEISLSPLDLAEGHGSPLGRRDERVAVAAPPAPPATANNAADAGAPAPMDAASLEVSNGNGTTGMAMQVGTWLAARGVATDHLTNQLPFDQRQTVIQYRSGHEDAALRLARLLPAPATTEAKATTGLRSDVRVVLGRDWAPIAPCLASRTCPPMARATTVAMQ